MEIDKVPAWFLALEQEDAAFLKNFVVKSGSLKEIARLYGVSYPTVRLRLDRLIQKIELSDHQEEEPGLYQGSGGGLPHRPGDGQAHHRKIPEREEPVI